MTSETLDENETSAITNNSTTEDESSTTNDFHPDEEEELQRKYLNMIKMCDVPAVQKLLENNSDFDLNCKNYQGMTGLNLAIEVNCEPMIDFLLPKPGLEIGDSLMRAIRGNHYPIVIKLLDTLQSRNPESAKFGYEHSTEFPQYLTPIMLAAQCGHYQIISLLLERGHTIPIPHKARCLCKEVSRNQFIFCPPINNIVPMFHQHFFRMIHFFVNKYIRNSNGILKNPLLKTLFTYLFI